MLCISCSYPPLREAGVGEKETRHANRPPPSLLSSPLVWFLYVREMTCLLPFFCTSPQHQVSARSAADHATQGAWESKKGTACIMQDTLSFALLLSFVPISHALTQNQRPRHVPSRLNSCAAASKSRSRSSGNQKAELRSVFPYIVPYLVPYRGPLSCCSCSIAVSRSRTPYFWSSSPFPARFGRFRHPYAAFLFCGFLPLFPPTSFSAYRHAGQRAAARG